MRLRAIGMRLQNGGVGYYPNAYTPFVHLDVGSVRAWPRMTRAQLASIFPDGKTVHVPSDGRPLPGYDEARAEVLAKGGTVAGYSAYADAEEAIASQPRRKSFWATLFGGGDDEDEDAEEIRAASRPGRALIASRQAAAAGLELLRQRFELDGLCRAAAGPGARAGTAGACRDPAAAGAAGARRGGGHRSRSA